VLIALLVVGLFFAEICDASEVQEHSSPFQGPLKREWVGRETVRFPSVFKEGIGAVSQPREISNLPRI
jgi:hypothetical protein